MNKHALLTSASPAAMHETDPNATPPAVPEKVERKKSRKATRIEIIKISDLLREHLEKMADGAWRYKGSHNDSSIAELVAPDLNGNHVGYVRQEVYGKLHRSDDSPSRERLNQLEDLFNRLAEEVGSNLRVTRG